MHAEEIPLHYKLPEDEEKYALFTYEPCRNVGRHQRWKAILWSPTQ